jgi:hypothetical protein
LFARQADEIDYLHIECSGDTRQGNPSWILLAALYPRDRDRVKIGFGRECFDAQRASLAQGADCGSKLGKCRLRHRGKPASRYRDN